VNRLGSFGLFLAACALGGVLWVILEAVTR
jgi:hypothetical protein